ncbi:DUF4241 domain-containing protein [Brevibacillus borstelensis]|uniref:DUF4241 domain-containing protein n=1 Tax=Brevibacillus borstelensis TaxID=45462 RepID=UPI0004F29797|nr:DUF4241 domain-containing protein [Brevibacillus borstelensis]KKX54255.1 cytoplasmic protein [Brevibacillus borstelensis cifa_chp40]
MSNLLNELANAESKTLRPEILEQLKVISGKIVACDPLISRHTPFERTIQPGAYPVIAWWHEEENCIAGAELKLSESRPVRWEMATVPGQNVEELEEGYIFGYPVDTGLGCFADLKAIEKMDELEEKLQSERGENFISLYDDLIDDLMTEHDDEWCNAVTDEDAGLNVIIFRSGYGDGFYATYWGIDESGKIVSLVTDFQVI